jgi:hypothetical protein
MSPVWPIVLKKAKMPHQQNLRKREAIINLGWRCSLGALEKAAE